MSMYSKRRDVGTVASCLFCDSFFVCVVATVPPARAFPGKKGTAAFEDLLERIQLEKCLGVSVTPMLTTPDKTAETATDVKLPAGAQKKKNKRRDASREATEAAVAGETATNTDKQREATPSVAPSSAIASPPPDVRALPCPTCAEMISGLRFGDYLETIRTAETPFSPCVFVSWDIDQPPALYLNPSQHEKGASGLEAKKPKWTLAQGVGPPGLELDSSRSGRVYKPSLRPLLEPFLSHPRVDRFLFAKWLATQSTGSGGAPEERVTGSDGGGDGGGVERGKSQNSHSSVGGGGGKGGGGGGGGKKKGQQVERRAETEAFSVFAAAASSASNSVSFAGAHAALTIAWEAATLAQGHEEDDEALRRLDRQLLPERKERGYDGGDGEEGEKEELGVMLSGLGLSPCFSQSRPSPPVRLRFPAHATPPPDASTTPAQASSHPPLAPTSLPTRHPVRTEKETTSATENMLRISRALVRLQPFFLNWESVCEALHIPAPVLVDQAEAEEAS